MHEQNSMSPVDPERDAELLEALRVPVDELTNRHLDRTKPWYPTDIIPYELGRNYNDEQPWTPEDYAMDEGVRSAIYVNLLTEDNLPWYTEVLAGMTSRDHPMHGWIQRWTAEEGRHSIAMRDWVHVTRAFDPHMLEDGRMAQVEGAEVPQIATVSEMLAYTSLQELATGVAHRNVGKELTKADRDNDVKRQGGRVMARLAGDEGHHHNFYADAAKAAIEVDPSTMLIAISHQLRHFAMPGTGIPGFKEHEMLIAASGIYDLKAFHSEVAAPTLRHWAIDSIDESRLSPEAVKARAAIHRRMASLGRLVAPKS